MDEPKRDYNTVKHEFNEIEKRYKELQKESEEWDGYINANQMIRNQKIFNFLIEHLYGSNGGVYALDNVAEDFLKTPYYDKKLFDENPPLKQAWEEFAILYKLYKK